MAPPLNATKKKIAKACQAMKPYGISAETVKSVLKHLLEAYEKNWTYIEDENYRVLLDAIFESEDPKRKDMKEPDFMLLDESDEEAEPPLKKTGIETISALDDNQWKRKKPYQFQPLAVIDPDGSSIGNCFNIKEKAPELQLITMEETDDHLQLYEYDSSNGNQIAKETASPFPETICQDNESPPRQSCANAYRFNNLVSTEGDNLLESKNVDTQDNGDATPVSSEIDIASSSNGEVKLCFSICKNSQRFCIPSLDAVLKRVEDKYCETCKGLGADFSLSELLKEMCESFLELTTTSDGNEQNVLPVLDNVKEPDMQGDQSSWSNGFETNDNPAEGLLQIPRPIISSVFNHLRSVEGLRLDRNNFSQDASSASNSMAIVPRDCSSPDLCSFLADITKGLENQAISLINEFNNEKLPAFTYIPKSVNYKNANVKPILARISNNNCCSDCFGDCLSPEVPCACASETGGVFAYTIEGLIEENFLKSCIAINQKPKKENYFYCDNCPLERTKEMIESGSCKGHLLRTFIKECWYKCGCGLHCGNRVVQRGITARLQVFMTPEGKGWGLRTLEDLPKGAFVCEYVGEIVTNTELAQRNAQNKNEKHTYPVLLDADWSSEGILRDEEALCLDAAYFGNVARFINHRCFDANMVEVPVEVESPDHHYYHLAFFTKRHVKALEELTWDYGIDFDDESHPVKAFECQCGSKFCTNLKREKRSRRRYRAN